MLENVDNEVWLANSYCGYRMTQLWKDFFLWEDMLNLDNDTEAIIELGTAHGGFSLYLLHQCEARGWDFFTYDNVDPINDDRMSVFGADGYGKCADLGEHFIKHDVLGSPDLVREQIQQYSKVILFCDNGNKAREVQLYAPSLATDSLCIVHDWNREIFAHDIPDCLQENYGTECDTIDSWTRVFRKCA